VSLTEKLSEEANKKMPYGESNGHVTDDVTRPERSKLAQMRLGPNILKTARDAIFINNR